MKKDSEETELLLSIFKFIGIMLLFSYSIYMYGWVILNYWDWFLLPVFPEMKVITFVQAVYLSTFLNLFKNHFIVTYNKEFREKYVDENSQYGKMFANPLVLLFIGFLIHYFVK